MSKNVQNHLRCPADADFVLSYVGCNARLTLCQAQFRQKNDVGHTTVCTSQQVEKMMSNN